MTPLSANKRVVKDWFDGLSNDATRELDTVGELLDPGASWWFLQDRSTVESRDSIVELLVTAIPRTFPAGMRFQIDEMTAEGDNVAVLARSWAITRDGVDYHNCYHFLFRVREGRIYSIREYMDTLHAKEVVYRR